MPSMNLNFGDPNTQNDDLVTGLPGFSPWLRWNGPQFRPGHTVTSIKGKTWVFGQASAAIAVATPAGAEMIPVAGAAMTPTPTVCAFNAATGAISAGAGYKAYAAFDKDEYGFVEKV
jgi:hypothetical protein